jgi:hypothetical protein
MWGRKSHAQLNLLVIGIASIQILLATSGRLMTVYCNGAHNLTIECKLTN